ncbi:ABC transporter substrate-binding protein [Corynebacterium sp. AOP34-AQ2-28]|uniref:ABC transporter substrate-binding protein n=1 Tax=unclassified Corynebacterium TaxID=2624378 RepID=UPI002647CBAD|nr:ABC transporter substrate-binding protein [Corynebacterium sp.]MDN5583125.1 ABC transporter substrate-binding protein [Corynebacterium sp.]MDN5720797.1 ABC transporter substrate-binding protein [Corynebacterium sp.]MDN6325619.1 ABC transporter substrate-binding protein [Corynebacterium sp.]
MQTARSTRRPLLITGAVLLSSVLVNGALVACGQAGADHGDDYDGPPISGGTLRAAFDTDIKCADGQQVGNNTALNVSRQITDSLTDQDPETGEIVPWLATSWDINDDSTEFTFHLRDGVTFQDGTAFTSASVKENFRQIVDLGAKSSLGSTYLAGLEGVDTPDPHTVTVRFARPNAQFLQASSTMTLGFYSPATFGKTPEQRCTGDLVGTGPFSLTDFNASANATLERNDDYDWPSSLADHAGPAYLDGIEFTVVPEAGVRNGSLASGQIDVDTAVQPQDEELLEQSGYPLVERPNPGVNYSFFPNWSTGPFQDVRVRQAVNKAINREELTAVLSSRQNPATSVLASTTPGYTDQSDLLTYDPEAASTLLDEAGWTRDDDTSTRTRDGEALEIPVGYWQTAPFLEVVQQQLRAVGVDLQLRRQTMSESAADQESDTNDIDFYNLTRSDPDVLRTVFDASGRNVNNRGPGRADDLLESSLTTLDPRERADIVADTTTELVEQGHVIPLTELSGISATAPEVHGFRYEGSSRLQLHDTWLSTAVTEGDPT